MRVLLRGVFLTGLLVPLAAHGQKRIVLPSIGLGAAYGIGPPDEHPKGCDFICRGEPGGTIITELQLDIFNPEGKLGYHRVSLMSGAYLLRTLTYGGGIASSGRYHFASLSIGPVLVFKEEGRLIGYRGETTRAGVTLGIQGQAGAFFMPLKFFGFGVSLDIYLPLKYGVASRPSVIGYRQEKRGSAFVVIVRIN